MGEDVAAKRLSADDAAKTRTAEKYTAGVMRAFAALAELGAVEDLGDFPPTVTVRPGELLATSPSAGDGATHCGPSSGPATRATTGTGRANVTSDAAATAEGAAVAAVLALPNKAQGRALQRSTLSVTGLHRHLNATVTNYSLVASDPAGTWQMLAGLHDRGALDVSAAPSRQLVTGLRVLNPALPGGFLGAVLGRAARAAAETAALSDFFSDTTTCANRKLATYFGVPDLPEGCCTHAGNRCSACWASGNWPSGQVKPKVAIALETPKPRPAGTRVDAAFAQRRLDERVYRLVWDIYNGVHVLDLFRALRGDDSYFNPRTKRRHRLRPALVNSRYFAASPSIRIGEVGDALQRLQTDGKVTAVGALWRESGHVARDAARAAKAAGVP